MRGAILAIGDELTCGYRLDTHSQAIARRLATVPLDVVAHLTVGDDIQAICDGLRAVLRAADVVVAAGGLGPTEDDVTRQAVAGFFGRSLVEDAEAVERIRLERIENAVDSPEPLTDRETLQLVRGVTPRISELIIHAGYKFVLPILWPF